MNQIRINDNCWVNQTTMVSIPNLTDRIANKTLEALERDGIFVFPTTVKNSSDLAKNQIILQQVNGKYRSGNVMGFLGCEGERLTIHSRFSTDKQDYFLQYLLESVLEMPNTITLETDANRDHRLVEMLILLFPHYLKSAMRKGVFKTYIVRQYNDNNVKGKIDVSRHIKQNTPFIGKIAYSKREYAHDNDLTELIRHTIEVIKQKNYGYTLLHQVQDEVRLIVETTANYEIYDRKKIIDSNKKKPVRQNFYHEYRSLQKLCIMILQHEKIQVGFGNHQIYGILFDGAWLWEEYVNSLIGHTFYHPMNKGHDGAQRLFTQNIGLIYPDFISRNQENRIIADAKYKPIQNIGNRDYLQVLAYMFRFDSKHGYYLYPESEHTDKLVLQMNQGSTYENNVVGRDDVSVTKLGLHIPDNTSSYDDFVKQMKINERVFCANLGLEPVKCSK